MPIASENTPIARLAHAADRIGVSPVATVGCSLLRAFGLALLIAILPEYATRREAYGGPLSDARRLAGSACPASPPFLDCGEPVDQTAATRSQSGISHE